MTVYAYTDRLTQPILINPSLTRTAITFVTAGWSHILSGIDHILYLLMLVVGAAALGRLAIWVTGFTIGHTITLIIGTFGFVPGFAWFFPSVEILIALSHHLYRIGRHLWKSGKYHLLADGCRGPGSRIGIFNSAV